MQEHKMINPSSDLMCSLLFDEMNIRQQILWNRQKCNYDGFVDGDKESVRVKQAIVFMLTGINYCLEFPVAYWFIQTLDQHNRKKLLLDVIEAVTKTGIQIKIITFDGYSSNIPMCELLGADLQVRSPNFHMFFINKWQQMAFLEKERHLDFVGASPTIEFIRILNRIFDIFNSKNMLDQNVYKKALNPGNKRIVFDFLQTCLDYLRGLKLRQTNKAGKSTIISVLKSKSHTGFQGFIINIHSLMELYVYRRSGREKHSRNDTNVSIITRPY